MKAGIIPLSHKGCWAGDTSTKFQKATLSIVPYKIYRTGYNVVFKIESTHKDIPDIKRFIQRHPSVDYFEHLQSNVYKVIIEDTGYSTGAVRILSRIKGVKLYKWVVMPVNNGLEHVTGFFDDEKAFNKSITELNDDDNIEVQKEECRLWTVEGDNICGAHSTIFTEIFNMSKDDVDLLCKSYLGDDLARQKLEEEKYFLELVYSYSEPVAKIILDMLGYGTLKDFYELMDIVLRRKRKRQW
mgnify:CR=1 FL=1